MGGSMAKPEFPNESQWNEWKAEQEKIVQAAIVDAEKRNRQNHDEYVKDGLRMFEVYMRNCQDVSGWKRFTRDNEACTMARADLMAHLAFGAADYFTRGNEYDKLQEMRERYAS